MAEHKFKIGAMVFFHPKKSGFPVNAPPGSYQITRRLPATDGEFQYVIKSTYEDYERIAKESELSRF